MPLVPSQQVEFTVLLAGLNASADSLRVNLTKTSRYNPGLQSSLAAVIRDMGAAAEKMTGLVNQDILSGTYATPPAEYFALTTASVEKGYQESGLEEDSMEFMVPFFAEILEKLTETNPPLLNEIKKELAIENENFHKALLKKLGQKSDDFDPLAIRQLLIKKLKESGY
jgi:hypothetical protein